MRKTTIAKLYIYNGVGARDLYIDEAHTALDNSGLQHFFLNLFHFILLYFFLQFISHAVKANYIIEKFRTDGQIHGGVYRVALQLKTGKFEPMPLIGGWIQNKTKM